MGTRELSVETSHRGAIVDLTDAVTAFLDETADGGDGLLNVFAAHATAGILVMELGSGSEADLLDTLDRLLPRDDRWRHAHGSPGPWG